MRKHLNSVKSFLKNERALSELETQLKLQAKANELENNSLKDKYESELKQKEETIAFYKDFKAKQSTKMVGESLEQHCEIENLIALE